MKQLFLQTEQSFKTCAFTGHRFLDMDFSERKLKKEVKKLIQMGVDTFYSGMAMGFDLIAAEIVLAFKKKNPAIRLICCIPFYGQDRNFSEVDKKRYTKILKIADEKILLSYAYSKDCMHKRNRYMADNADVLVAYCKKQVGGTAYTVRYFEKIKPFNKIIFI